MQPLLSQAVYPFAASTTEADCERVLDALDWRLVGATQQGLPRVARPYHSLAASLGVTAEEVMQRLQRMRNHGMIRRIGAVPNHYQLGFKANGMSVWDVRDKDVDRLGQLVGKLDFVSHCYHRPRHLPVWPYNLFAMVHGRDRNEVWDKIHKIASCLGNSARSYDVLFSTRILKKSGLRLSAKKSHCFNGQAD